MTWKIHLPLREGETSLSYCRRLAVHSGSPSFTGFLTDMGILMRDHMVGAHGAIERVADFGGVDPAILERATFKEVQGHAIRNVEYSIQGQRIERRHIRLRSAMICRCCIEDDGATPFIRAEWHMAPFRACPVHGEALLPCRGWLTLGNDLSGTGKVVPLRPSRLEMYLRGRLSGTGGLGDTWLDALPFSGVADISEIIGLLTVAEPKIAAGEVNLFTLRHRTTSPVQAQAQEAGDIGWQILGEGQANFRRFLERFAATARDNRKGMLGPICIFGPLYRWLDARNDDPDYAPIRDLVRDVVVNSAPIPPATRIFRTEAGERHPWMLHAAARSEERQQKRLRRSLDAVGAATTMSLGQAAIHIGAHQSDVSFLAQAGILQAAGEGAKLIFARQDLDAFLAKLHEAIRFDPSYLVDTENIPTIAGMFRCSALDVLELLFSGALTEVYRDPMRCGYLSVLVNVLEIRPFLANRRPNLSFREVAGCMSWDENIPKHLVNRGLLRAEAVICDDGRGRVRQPTIRSDDLEEFDRRYAVLGSAGAGSRDHPETGIRAKPLGLSGIKPAFKGPVGSRIYRRSDLQQ